MSTPQRPSFDGQNRTLDVNSQTATRPHRAGSDSKDNHLRSPATPDPRHRDSLRGIPPSPRSHRQPSFSQQTFAELLANPPVARHGEARFQGRDWRTIQVHEITDPDEVRFVQVDTSVEEATNVLISHGAPNVIFIRESAESRRAIGTFGYSDLNAYLLMVVGLAHPDQSSIQPFNELAKKGREGKTIPLKDVKDLGKKAPLATLPHTADLSKAVEILGSGVHRLAILQEGTMDVVGILTQLRLVRFFWEQGRNFPAIDQLYPATLQDLKFGSTQVLAINGDKPLTDALELMYNEGVTSIPVLDNQRNVIGNISQVDVRLLTKTTSLPLLRSTCIHFISVILSERGVNDGKDSFPVFHVSPVSTLAHTVAKLVATRSHRMWIVDVPSPSTSGPPTPIHQPAVFHLPSHGTGSSGHTATHHAPSAPGFAAGAGAHHAPSISASSLPGYQMSGRLSGVVSLTDILNLYAKASGLNPHDPTEIRRARRRSSSSSLRRSVDSVRSSISADPGGSGILGRSPSMRGAETAKR